MLLIDIFNVRKDLPVLLSLLENRYCRKEVILITSSPVFNLIWKFLEKHDYSLILKPDDLDKMNVIICSAIAKIKRKRGLLEKRANIHDLNTDMQFSDHFQLSPKDLMEISSTLVGELFDDKEERTGKGTLTENEFSNDDLKPISTVARRLVRTSDAHASQFTGDGAASVNVHTQVSEELLPMFCDSLPIGVLELGEGNVIISANPVIEKALGFAKGEMPGHALGDFIAVKDQKVMERLLAVTGLGGTQNETSEVHFIDKAVKAIPFIAQSFLLSQGHGRSRLFITLRDVEERRQLAALQQSHQDLENYINSIGERLDRQTMRRDDMVARSRLSSLAYLNGKTAREIRAAIGNILNIA